MDIQGDVTAVNNEVAAIAGKIKNAILGINAEILKALGFAEEALPQVAELISASAAVLSVACPTAAGPLAVMGTALNAVTMADQFAITADGLMVHPADAEKLGVAILAKPTNDQKAAAAKKMVQNLHPELKPELAANAAAVAVQAAVAQLHHVTPTK